MNAIFNKCLLTTICSLFAFCLAANPTSQLSVKLIKDHECQKALETLPPGVTFSRADPCAFFFDTSKGVDHIFEKSDYDTEARDVFEFTFQEPKIIRLGTFKQFNKLVLLPGDSLHILIDDLNEIFEIKGKSAPAQNLFNELKLNTVSGLGFSYWLEAELSHTMQLLADTIEATMQPFLELVKKDVIPQEFYKIIKNDVTYNLAYQVAVSLNIRIKDDPSQEEAIFEILDKLYSEYPIHTEAIKPSLLFSEYLEQYGWYIGRKKGKDYYAKEKTEEEIGAELAEIKAVTSEESYEFHAIKLFNLHLSRMNKAVVPHYLEYKKAYPDSHYPNLIFDLDRKYEKMMNLSAQELNSNVAFLEHDSINSLQDLAQRVEGDFIYLDLWASWCGPCMYLFQYKPQLEELLTQQEVTLVYLSVDKASFKEAWLNRIKEFQLKGKHLLANTDLIADIRNKTTWTGFIPRFILLDANGNVVNGDIASPGEIELLERQLQEGKR